jgi:hypothetical protein
VADGWWGLAGAPQRGWAGRARGARGCALGAGRHWRADGEVAKLGGGRAAPGARPTSAAAGQTPAVKRGAPAGQTKVSAPHIECAASACTRPLMRSAWEGSVRTALGRSRQATTHEATRSRPACGGRGGEAAGGRRRGGCVRLRRCSKAGRGNAAAGTPQRPPLLPTAPPAPVPPNPLLGPNQPRPPPRTTPHLLALLHYFEAAPLWQHQRRPAPTCTRPRSPLRPRRAAPPTPPQTRPHAPACTPARRQSRATPAAPERAERSKACTRPRRGSTGGRGSRGPRRRGRPRRAWTSRRGGRPRRSRRRRAAGWRVGGTRGRARVSEGQQGARR